MENYTKNSKIESNQFQLDPYGARANLTQNRKVFGEIRNNIPRKTTKSTTRGSIKIFDESKSIKENTSLACDRLVIKKDVFKDITSQIDTPRSSDVPKTLCLGTLNVEACDLGLLEYRDEIFKNLCETEKRVSPNPNYMKKQKDITSNMRIVLVDWLVEVAGEYRISDKCLHLAVNCIDRFLTRMLVVRNRLQLVGTSAMFLASKFEEIYPQEVAEFVYITDETYDKAQVLKMEQLLLKVLDFNLAVPTAVEFLTLYLKITNASTKIEHLAHYLCDLSLLDMEILKFYPSVVAASAVYLANYTLTHSFSEDDILENFTNYTISDLLPCIKTLRNLFQNASNLTQQSICEKYRSPKYSRVSDFVAPEIIDEEEMEFE